MIGRLLKAKMTDIDTPERIAQRLRSNEACRLGRDEAFAKFHPLTAENAAEAMQFMQDRIRYYETMVQCSVCKGYKPSGQSCGCFDNGGQ